MDISTLHEEIEDNMTRQTEWDMDDFINDASGIDSRRMSEDELTQYFAEQMGQGIKRRGGNY